MKMTMITENGSCGWPSLAASARNSTPVQRDVAALRDPPDDPRRAGEQARAVAAAPELRRHELAAGLAGEAVGDPLLEAVADLDPDPPLLDRDEDQQAVVLALVADAAAVILEQLDGVLADVAVRLDGRHGGDDDDVAAGRLERADRCGRLRARLSGSMTCAKSLTGSVSSGRAAAGAAAAEAGATTASADQQQRRSSHDDATTERPGHRSATSASVQPSMYATSRSTASRYGGNRRSHPPTRSRTRVSATTSDWQAAGQRDRAFDARGRICRVGRAAVEPRDARRAAPRAAAPSARSDRPARRRVPAVSMIAFAQVQQVAARLDLAGAPQVRRVDRQAVERIRSRTRPRGRRGWRRTRTETRRASGRTRARSSKQRRREAGSCHAATRAAQARRSAA